MIKRLLFIFIITLTTQIQAQHFITGWKASFNASNPILINAYDEKDPFSERLNWSRLGFEISIFKDINLSNYFFIRTNLGYTLRTHNRTIPFDHGTYFSSINVAGNVHVHLSKRINLYSGLNFGGIVNVHARMIPTYSDDQIGSNGSVYSEGDETQIENIGVNVTSLYNPIDILWELGLNIKLNEHWFIDLKHGRSIIDINNNVTRPKTYLQTFSLGIVKTIK